IRSDIYALGCTFYFMLAGRCPFPDGSLPERILQHMTKEPPDVREFNPHISVGLEIILRRMLAKKPEERYQTPQDLLQDLENPDRLTHHLAKDEQFKHLADLADLERPSKKLV